jgi:hypothetical protein
MYIRFVLLVSRKTYNDGIYLMSPFLHIVVTGSGYSELRPSSMFRESSMFANAMRASSQSRQSRAGAPEIGDDPPIVNKNPSGEPIVDFRKWMEVNKGVVRLPIEPGMSHVRSCDPCFREDLRMNDFIGPNLSTNGAQT